MWKLDVDIRLIFPISPCLYFFETCGTLNVIGLYNSIILQGKALLGGMAFFGVGRALLEKVCHYGGKL